MIEADIAKLVREFADSIIKQREAIGSGNRKLITQCGNRRTSIAKKLVLMGGEARQQFATLLDHPNRKIRATAAVYLCSFMPERALAVFRALAEGDDLIALGAQMRIKEWEEHPEHYDVSNWAESRPKPARRDPSAPKYVRGELPRLRRVLMETLAVELGRYGFVRRAEDFVRPTSYGWDKIDITFHAFARVSFEPGMGVGVRYDSVEALITRFNPGARKKYEDQMSTIGNRVFNILGMSDYDWADPARSKMQGVWPWHNVSTEEDVPVVARCMMDVVKSVALPYFERFSSLEEVLTVLTSKGEDLSRFNLGLEPQVSMRAVAISYLLRNREAFDVVVEQRAGVLEEMGERYWRVSQQHHKFVEMVQYLRERWGTDVG